MSILRKIVEQKKERLSSAKSKTPLARLRSMLKEADNPRAFTSAVKRESEQMRFIAEIKKASPSQGVIRQHFDHREIALIYEDRKADAVSVLTEEDFFQGSLEYLPEVKKIVTMPLLRKDFIIDEYQLFEARAFGADAVLLIAAILDLHQAEEYYALTRELGMAAIFEIHNEKELETGLAIQAPIIGINNRDLTTLRTDISTTARLKKELPHDCIVISESGIQNRDDVIVLDQSGVDAILVGTCLMESPDIGKKIDRLRGVD